MLSEHLQRHWRLRDLNPQNEDTIQWHSLLDTSWNTFTPRDLRRRWADLKLKIDEYEDMQVKGKSWLLTRSIRVMSTPLSNRHSHQSPRTSRVSKAANKGPHGLHR